MDDSVAAGHDGQTAEVVLARDGQIATLTLAQPSRRNAIDESMWRQFGAALEEISLDRDVRVLILTGSGEHFCAGADLASLAASSAEDHPLARQMMVGRYVLALHRLAVPTIARVDGVAIGIGFNLALGCDFVVASHRARFSEFYASRALTVDGGGSWLLPRLVGVRRAKELLLLPEILSAAEVHALGLANRVVAPDALDEEVRDLARRLCAIAPVAVQQMKRLVDGAAEWTFEQALDAEIRAQSINLQGADAPEALRAFLNKREPRYTGGGFRDFDQTAQ